MRSAKTIIIMLTIGVPASCAHAGRIVMLNGDVLTGDIKKIWDGEVTFEPEYADAFDIDTDKIAHLQSDREFDIVFPDHTEAKAKLVGGGDGTQMLEIDGRQREVPVSQLVQLDEPDDYYDWDTNVDANSVVNTGNTDSQQATVQVTTNLKLGDHRHIADLSFAREEVSGTTTKEQDRADYAYNWQFSDPWFFGLNASAERDPIRDLDYRYNVGTGIGVNFWDEATRFFQIQSVVGWQEEKISGDTTDSAVAGWIVRFRYEIINDLTFFHDDSFLTTISGRDNNVFNSSTGVRYSITDLLYANIQFDYDHESNPAQGVKKTDTTTLIGVGVEL